MLVRLVAEVGLTYVEIRTLERRIQLARTNVGLQRQSLEISESRYPNGKVSQLDATECQSHAPCMDSMFTILKLARRS